MTGTLPLVPRQVGCGQVTGHYAEFFTSFPQSYNPHTPMHYAQTYPQHQPAHYQPQQQQYQQEQQIKITAEVRNSSPPSLTQLGQMVSRSSQLVDFGTAGVTSANTFNTTTNSPPMYTVSKGVLMQQEAYCEVEEPPSCAYTFSHLQGMPYVMHGESMNTSWGFYVLMSFFTYSWVVYVLVSLIRTHASYTYSLILYVLMSLISTHEYLMYSEQFTYSWVFYVFMSISLTP